MANNAKLLRKLESAMPVMDEQRKRQQEAARNIQLQQQVAATPVQAQPAPAAQAIGAQQAAVAGQQTVQRAQVAQQEKTQINKGQLAVEQSEAQLRAVEAKLGLDRENIRTEADLAAVQRRVEDHIFQNQVEFKTDALGQTEYKEDQLMDFAIVTAESQEQLRNKAQQIQQATKEDVEMMNALASKLDSILKGEAQLTETTLNGETRQRIAQYKKDLMEKANKKNSAAKNRIAMFETVGTVAGGVVGAIYGGPPGGVAGAKAGGAGGKAIGGATA